MSAPAVYPIGRAARDRFVLDATRSAPPRGSVGGAPGRRRSRTRRARRRRRRRDVVPDRPRVSVALRDVRPVARHDGDRHAPSARSRTRSGLGLGLGSGCTPTSQAVQRGQLLRSPGGAARGRCGDRRCRSHTRCAVTVESHPRLVGDRTWRFRDRLAPVARGRDGPRDGASGGPRAPEQGLHASTTSQRRRPRSRRTASACACSCSSIRRSCHATNATHGCGRSIDVAIEAGASVISLIPTRSDTGAMAALAAARLCFVPHDRRS